MLKHTKSLTTAEFTEMVDFTVDTGTNLLVLGPSGIGKTEIPIERCRKQGHNVIYWNLATKEAPDLIGQSMIDKSTMTTVYAPPVGIPTKFVDDNGNPIPGAVIVIDELDKCEKELQNPLLEVLDKNQRSLGGTRLNIKAVIATGNLPDEHAFAKPLNHALVNRCGLYRVDANLEDWTKDFANPTLLNPLIVGFLTQDGSDFFCEKTSKDPNDHLRGSPRSWTDAARKLTYRQEMVADGRTSNRSSDEEIWFQTSIIAGCVGELAALKFQIWLEHYRDIRPMVGKILEGKPLLDTERERIKNNLQSEMVVAFSVFGEFNRMVKLAMDRKYDREELFARVARGSEFMASKDNVRASTVFAAMKSTFTDSEMFGKTQVVSIPAFRQLIAILRQESIGFNYNER